MHPAHITLSALLLAAAASSAIAHDTWFARAPADAGPGALALGTGNLYPKQEFAIDPQYLARQGCRSAAGTVQPLRTLRISDVALLLAAPAAGTLTCWAQLQAFEIEIAAEHVALYLDEIRAPKEMRERWAALQARGVVWKERYTKHARTLLASEPAAHSLPAGIDIGIDPDMNLDLRLAPGQAPPKVGMPVVFQLLSGGQPLPGLALQFRSELSPLGFWAQTDAQGQVRMTVPLPGRWLLRGTELKPSVDRPDAWDSRFITLAFEALPAPARAIPTAP